VRLSPPDVSASSEPLGAKRLRVMGALFLGVRCALTSPSPTEIVNVRIVCFLLREPVNSELFAWGPEVVDVGAGEVVGLELVGAGSGLCSSFFVGVGLGEADDVVGAGVGDEVVGVGDGLGRGELLSGGVRAKKAEE